MLFTLASFSIHANEYNNVDMTQDCDEYATEAAQMEWGDGFFDFLRALANPGAYEAIWDYYHDVCVEANAEGSEALLPVFV